MDNKIFKAESINSSLILGKIKVLEFLTDPSFFSYTNLNTYENKYIFNSIILNDKYKDDENIVSQYIATLLWIESINKKYTDNIHPKISEIDEQISEIDERIIDKVTSIKNFLNSGEGYQKYFTEIYNCITSSNIKTNLENYLNDNLPNLYKFDINLLNLNKLKTTEINLFVNKYIHILVQYKLSIEWLKSKKFNLDAIIDDITD